MKTENLLKYIILTGLFAIPFVPLIVSKSLFFPFITGKAFVFRFLVEIIFAAWALLALRDSEYRPKFSWILGAVFVFLLSIGVADIFSENSFKSFWSNYERMEGFIGILHFAILFLVAGSVLKTQSVWNKLLATSIGASLIMAIYSFFQIAGSITINQGGVRVDGTLGNASYLGIYMVFNIFFAGILFMRTKVAWQRYLLGIVALLDITILYYTATRGAILGFLGGALVSLIYLALKSEKGEKIRKITLGIVFGILIFVSLFIAVKNTEFVKTNPVLNRFSSLSISEIQTQGRYFVWPIAWKGFLERPVFGWGQESFNFVFNKYYSPKMYDQEPWFDRTHNVVLDWLIAGGLLGFLSYLSIFVALLFYIKKADEKLLTKEDKAVMLGLLCAYVFHNLFVFDQIASYILFFILLAYMHAHSPETNFGLWQRISNKFNNIFTKDSTRPIVEAFVVILLIISLYSVIYVPLQQNKDLLKALIASSQGQTDIVIYKKPIENYAMGFSESVEHVSNMAITISSQPDVSQELKQGLFLAMDTAFQRQIGRAPNDARYRLFYGSFLSRFGLYDRSLEQLDKAKELSPQKQGVYFERVNILLAKGDLKNAISEAKFAYELEPSFREARIIYALTALSVGDTVLYNSLIETVPADSIIFDDRFITVLANQNNFDKVIEIANIRIQKQPTNLNHRLTLAAAYLQSGQRNNAITTIQEIIKIDPTFKEKGDYYISEIRAGRNP